MHLVRIFLLWISRLLLGFTFIFSGFVKAIDPVGSSIKFEDYFSAMHLGVLAPYALMFAFLLAAIEFLLGVNILLSLSPRQSSHYVLVIMAFMTTLTLYLAIANPVSDCGCFGDAIKLTNWETFAKNIVLLAAAIHYYKNRHGVAHVYHHKIHWVPSILTFVFALVVSFHNYAHLPDIDFLPYKIGSNIPQGMAIPEGSPTDQFETTFIYQKNGEKKEFSLQNYPANDTTWHFVDQKSVLVKKGFEPKIHDFSITLKKSNEEITDIVLQDTSFTFLLISPKLSKASDAHIDQINDIYDFSRDRNLSFYALTASSDSEIRDWNNGTGAEYPFCFTDATTLKTMIRANPGLMLLKNGTIVGKWNSIDIPNEEEMSDYLQKVNVGAIKNNAKEERTLLWTSAGVILAFLLLLLGIEKLAFMVKKRNRRKKTELLTLTNKLIMRKKIVAGNWKMNKTLQEGLELAKELDAALAGKAINCDVVIGVPYIHLASVAQAVDTAKVGVAAQNCADKASGAYTGEISASMVVSTGAKYVILGHSERRAYYGETTAILKEKTLLALANGLTPIFCIGEVLEEREAGKQNEVVTAQIVESLFDLSAEDFGKIVLAYEPVWAIGTGKTATAAQAQEIHEYIRQVVAGKYGAAVADNTSILYGGSCNAANAKELFANPDVDGGLIGGAALTVAAFMPIIEAWG